MVGVKSVEDHGNLWKLGSLWVNSANFNDVLFETNFSWLYHWPFPPRSIHLSQFHPIFALNLSRLTHFSSGKIWFEIFDLCKQFWHFTTLIKYWVRCTLSSFCMHELCLHTLNIFCMCLRCHRQQIVPYIWTFARITLQFC